MNQEKRAQTPQLTFGAADYFKMAMVMCLFTKDEYMKHIGNMRPSDFILQDKKQNLASLSSSTANSNDDCNNATNSIDMQYIGDDVTFDANLTKNGFNKIVKLLDTNNPQAATNIFDIRNNNSYSTPHSNLVMDYRCQLASNHHHVSITDYGSSPPLSNNTSKSSHTKFLRELDEDISLMGRQYLRKYCGGELFDIYYDIKRSKTASQSKRLSLADPTRNRKQPELLHNSSPASVDPSLFTLVSSIIDQTPTKNDSPNFPTFKTSIPPSLVDNSKLSQNFPKHEDDNSIKEFTTLSKLPLSSNLQYQPVNCNKNSITIPKLNICGTNSLPKNIPKSNFVTCNTNNFIGSSVSSRIQFNNIPSIINNNHVGYNQNFKSNNIHVVGIKPNDITTEEVMCIKVVNSIRNIPTLLAKLSNVIPDFDNLLQQLATPIENSITNFDEDKNYNDFVEKFNTPSTTEFEAIIKTVVDNEYTNLTPNIEKIIANLPPSEFHNVAQLQKPHIYSKLKEIRRKLRNKYAARICRRKRLDESDLLRSRSKILSTILKFLELENNKIKFVGKSQKSINSTSIDSNSNTRIRLNMPSLKDIQPSYATSTPSLKLSINNIVGGNIPVDIKPELWLSK